MSQPFRVLWVEDQLSARPPEYLRPVWNRIEDLAKEAEGSFAAHFTRNLSFAHDARAAIIQPIAPVSADWRPEYLEQLDVLILDIGLDPSIIDFLTRENCQHCLPNINTEELKELNEKFAGAAYYLARREDLLSCQAVIILSGFDEANRNPVPALRHLEQWCDGDSLPWTVKFPTTSEGIASVADLVEALYRDYSEGYTRLDQRGAIEFAASHDFPVLIVGESGTGKEYIAQAIHKRWVQQHRKHGQSLPSRPTVVNCAGLSPELARSELFGHLKGSFTGATEDRIGAILEACGVRRLDKPATSDFRDSLVARNFNLLRKDEDGPDIHFITTGPFGTLFLDELGDLPLEAQTLLLRFLQEKEVQPLGFVGRVAGANVRIIAATSDPRIAQFVGESLSGSWRTDLELERSVRQDLIFRIKGQVIRAEPVPADKDEVKQIIQGLLTKRKERDLWTDEAIRTWASEIAKQLQAVDEASAALQRGERIAALPAFGHLREINTVIDLATRYVEGAAERGLRRVDSKVTWEVVRKVWKPAVVTAVSALPQTTAGPTDTDAADQGQTLRSRLDQTLERLGLRRLDAKLAWQALSDTVRDLRTKTLRSAGDAGIPIDKSGTWDGKDMTQLLLELSLRRDEKHAEECLGELSRLVAIKGSIYRFPARARAAAFAIRPDSIRDLFRGILSLDEIEGEPAEVVRQRLAKWGVLTLDDDRGAEDGSTAGL